ncbi:MAG: aspartate 1-decarboxylase [Helicobacteraceae bacterium]|jgi:aspartate 1-decarboxylase|nr:aspartate 1-decarboxylase [Helicobacteraceae bacterium]
MLREMMNAKIHRATVTDANLNYVGSITIDEVLLEASGILVGQKVDVLNLNNGERFHTYAIKGEKHSGQICLNGAAARKALVGDRVIIVAYALMDDREAATYKPSIVLVDENNVLTRVVREIQGY